MTDRQLTNREIKAAIARVQAGTSTPDDGNMLLAEFERIWGALEVSRAGSDDLVATIDLIGPHEDCM